MLTIRDYFLFVADVNAHNHECFGSTTTIRAFDFVTVSGCDQLVVPLFIRPMHLVECLSDEYCS